MEHGAPADPHLAQTASGAAPALVVADSTSIAMNAEMRTIGIPPAITDRRLKSLLELGSSPFVQCCQVADDALEL